MTVESRAKGQGVLEPPVAGWRHGAESVHRAPAGGHLRRSAAGGADGEELGFGACFRSDHYLGTGTDGLPGPSDEAEVRRRAAAIGQNLDGLRRDHLAGTVEEVRDKIGRYAESGPSRLYLQTLYLGDLDHLASWRLS
ncbi:MAG: hypothetical protein WKF79_02435 [Nocardioides sp.]